MKFFLKVIKGSGRGKRLGFPTLNFEASPDLHLPFGVYRCFIRPEDPYSYIHPFLGALFFGPREMFQEPEPSFEVHLLNIRTRTPGHVGDIFEIDVREKIRDVTKFESSEKLKEAIKEDLAEIRRLSQNEA